jgi:hypothetical protein
VTGPSLVEFHPVALGPFEIARIPMSGAVAATGFLVGLGLAARQARRASLSPWPALELFALGAPAVLLASRIPAIMRAFPAFLHDAHALATALTQPGSPLPGALAGVVLVAAFAWASRQPARFADAIAPGALVTCGASAAAMSLAHGGDARVAAALALLSLAAALGAMAWASRRPAAGRVAVAAAPGCVALLAWAVLAAHR